MVRSIKERLVDLKSRGVTLTMQRRVILEFLHEHPGHWTAEQIFTELRARHGSLSRATVYNTLELLCSHGELEALRILKDVTHYDTNTQVHHHFHCCRCGRLFDLLISCPITASCSVQGHSIERMLAVFEGTCERCGGSGFNPPVR